MPSNACFGAAKSPVDPKPPQGEARFGTVPSLMCGGAFLAANPAHSRYRVPARRLRQARPGQPDRPVSGSSPYIIYRVTTPDGPTRGMFLRWAGGVVVGHACIGALVAQVIGQELRFSRQGGLSGFVLRAIG